MPLVILASHPDEPRLQAMRCPVLPLVADPEAVHRALWAAVRGEELGPVAPIVEPETRLESLPEPAEDQPTRVSVIAVAGGQGSPGRTTVALSLAAALGAVDSTVLVDADLSAPSVAAHLDADPTRNLYMVAHAEPKTEREWARAIAQETQRIAPRSREGVALCGVPKPEMRAGVSARFFEQLVGELQQRYRYVILDVGADLLGTEGALHRTALRLAQQILLVASADVVGLWRARGASSLLQSQLQISLDRVALVVNRHDHRHHHGRPEIEWSLGLPTAAVIPFDHAAVQRAIAGQRPLVLDEGSRAGRVLLDLAERIHGGNIVLPPEQAHKGWTTWLRSPALWPRRNGHAQKGTPHGDHVAPVR